MSKINACMKCGKRSVEPRAVLPGSGARVCLDCYQQEVDCVPLPSPAPPVPIPYPGTMQAHAGQFEPRTKKARIGNRKVVTKGKSSIPMSRGDEPGTMKGILSSKAIRRLGAMGILRAAKLREQQGGGE